MHAYVKCNINKIQSRIHSALKIKESISSILSKIKNKAIFNFTSNPKFDNSILALGSKFIPKPKILNIREILDPIMRLRRALLIKFHVFEDDGDGLPPPKLKVKSTWEPDINEFNPNQRRVHDLFSLLYKKIIQKYQNSSYRYSSVDVITQALQDIRNNPKIKVTLTDKNLGLAIFNTLDYHRLVLKHLENKVYHIVQLPPDTSGPEYVSHIVENAFRNLVHYVKFTKHETKFLNFREDKSRSYIGIFHGLPKVHKNKPLPIMPLRPIIAGRPSQIQARVSVVLGNRLLPYLSRFKSILHKSEDLMSEINGSDISNAYFVSVDFESLYTSIPLKDLFDTLSSYEGFTPKFAQEMISMLRFIFNHNYFHYADVLYCQSDGIAMGTNVAPILANLYLAIKFDRYISNIPAVSKFGRYIDDCILLVDTNVDFQQEILPQLLQFANPIKLTFHQGLDSIDFLDLTLFRSSNNTVASKIFQKPLNNYNYIPLMSNHPTSTLRGFIIGELIRYRRCSTFIEDFNHIANLFYDRLLSRGYNAKFVTRVYTSFTEKYTSDSTTSSKESEESDVFSLVIRHSYQPTIHKWLRDELRGIFNILAPNQEFDFRLAFKSNPNLSQLTMRSNLSTNQIALIKETIE